MPIRTPPSGSGHFGQGVSYPLTYDTNGRLGLSYGPKLVDEAMQSLCQTVLGERVMQPDYGIGAAFEPYDVGRMTERLRETIANHEPRIDSSTIRVFVNGTAAQGEANLTVQYNLIGDANERTLTFPFWSVS